MKKPYFPLFISLEGRDVLVIGGGNVATRKVEKILPFGCRITIVAPEITHHLKELATRYPDAIHWKKTMIDSEDTLIDALTEKKWVFIIAATGNPTLNANIHRQCRKYGLLCNSVDDPEHCDFLFPALITRGPISIGISTAGTLPALSAILRQLIEDYLAGFHLEKALTIGGEYRGKTTLEELIELIKRALVADDGH